MPYLRHLIERGRVEGGGPLIAPFYLAPRPGRDGRPSPGPRSAIGRRCSDQLGQSPGLAVDVAMLEHERAARAPHRRSLARAGSASSSAIAAASAAASPGGTSLPHSGRDHLREPDLVAGDDRDLHRQRLLDDDRHRVAVAVGGDDARHREQVGPLEQRRAPLEVAARGSSTAPSSPSSPTRRLELAPQRSVTGDHETRARIADRAGVRAASTRSVEPLLLDVASDRDDRPAAGRRGAAAKSLAVDAHDDALHLRRARRDRPSPAGRAACSRRSRRRTPPTRASRAGRSASDRCRSRAPRCSPARRRAARRAGRGSPPGRRSGRGRGRPRSDRAVARSAPPPCSGIRSSCGQRRRSARSAAAAQWVPRGQPRERRGARQDALDPRGSRRATRARRRAAVAAAARRPRSGRASRARRALAPRWRRRSRRSPGRRRRRPPPNRRHPAPAAGAAPRLIPAGPPPARRRPLRRPASGGRSRSAG